MVPGPKEWQILPTSFADERNLEAVKTKGPGIWSRPWKSDPACFDLVKRCS